MKSKRVMHHTALVVTLVLTVALTIFMSAFSEESQAAVQTANENVENVSSENDISDRIIVSATNYLQLTSDGNIDEVPQVEAAIEPAPRMVIDISEDEIYLIACQVAVEAGGEPYDAMVGVADVIINRVKSGSFPNTVNGVIYQSGQFPPAYNGVLDSVRAKGPGETCMQATIDALYGANTIGNYLYFNMASGVNTSSCSSYVQIGSTIFYMP